MNILPLVFTFLIIFSCITFTFMREVKSFSLIETTLHSFNRADRTVNNGIVSKEYDKVPEKDKPDKKESSTPKKQGYNSRRSLFPPLNKSKFNLSPLVKWEGEVKLHPLYETLARFLRVLYAKSLFGKQEKTERLEYRLIDEILKNAKKSPDAKDLAELHPHDPALSKIYYKMLKGTNQYTNREGIPPLRHFLCMEKTDKAAVLCFASPSLLEALFDEELTKEILNHEEKKWEESKKYHYLSKEDFQQIINKFPAKAPLLATLEPYLDTSKQFETRDQIGTRDPVTGIAIERYLN